MGGRVDGWMDEQKGAKTILRIAYINEKKDIKVKNERAKRQKVETNKYL